MLDGIATITLQLDREECVRGESVFFDIVLENTSKSPIAGLPLFTDEDPGVHLTADGPGGPSRATRLSAEQRDGVHRHEPTHEPEAVTLGPGKKMVLRDDVLSWFGELEPGTYTLRAHHRFEMESAPVTLKVSPAAPVFASTPHFAAQSPLAPMTAAWVHQPKNHSAVLFYQQQSPTLPRNPVHGPRVAELEEPVRLFAAAAPDSAVKQGHLVWLDDRGRLQVAFVDVGNPRIRPAHEVKTPFAGELLNTPLSMLNGSVFIPIVDESRENVAVLEVQPDGTATPYLLKLDSGTPMGPYCCFWEYDKRMHLAWAAQHGREIRVARLDLSDPASGFIVRSAHVSDDPVLWIESYLDLSSKPGTGTYFEHQVSPDQKGQPTAPPGPRHMLWCVTQAAGGLSSTRVDLHDNVVTPAGVLPTADLKEPRVLSSVVMYHKYDLALLIADARDQLYYGSTSLGQIEPLGKLLGQEITLREFPGLITASRQGSYAWVYLRYVNQKSSIAYARLEPKDKQDPVERHQAAKPGPRSKRRP